MPSNARLVLASSLRPVEIWFGWGQVSRVAWTACWYLSWALEPSENWKKYEPLKGSRIIIHQQNCQEYVNMFHSTFWKIGSIFVVFQVPCLFLAFLFSTSQAPVARHWSLGVACTGTYISKDPWYPLKIVNKLYHIHIIQHLQEKTTAIHVGQAF